MALLHEPELLILDEPTVSNYSNLPTIYVGPINFVGGRFPRNLLTLGLNKAV